MGLARARNKLNSHPIFAGLLLEKKRNFFRNLGPQSWPDSSPFLHCLQMPANTYQGYLFQWKLSLVSPQIPMPIFLPFQPIPAATPWRAAPFNPGSQGPTTWTILQGKSSTDIIGGNMEKRNIFNREANPIFQLAYDFPAKVRKLGFSSDCQDSQSSWPLRFAPNWSTLCSLIKRTASWRRKFGDLRQTDDKDQFWATIREFCLARIIGAK